MSLDDMTDPFDDNPPSPDALDYAIKPLPPFFLAITQIGLTDRARALPDCAARRKPLLEALRTIEEHAPYEEFKHWVLTYITGIKLDRTYRPHVEWSLSEANDLLYLARGRYGA